MTKLIFIALATFTFFVSPHAHAAVSPLGIGILAPIQFPPEDFTVAGVRVSALYGHNRNIYGIDLGGLGNITDGDFTGIAVSGIFNSTYGPTTIIGAQAAGILNVNRQKTKVWGVQVALVNSNTAESSVVGLSLGAANLTEHTNVYGLQAGLYNKAYDVYGFQIGVLNFCSSLHGLQIGLLNFQEKGLFKVSPILNFGF